jgi:hypothetical protein
MSPSDPSANIAVTTGLSIVFTESDADTQPGAIEDDNGEVGDPSEQADSERTGEQEGEEEDEDTSGNAEDAETADEDDNQEAGEQEERAELAEEASEEDGEDEEGEEEAVADEDATEDDAEGEGDEQEELAEERIGCDEVERLEWLDWLQRGARSPSRGLDFGRRLGVGAGPEKSTEVLEPSECDLGQTAAIDARP